MSWFVYMLDCDGTALYTGVTTDVERRVQEHQSGGRLAARYTRSRQHVSLVYAIEAEDKSQAMQIEYRLRRLSAVNKRAIIAHKTGLNALLQMLDLDH